ncbi:hypothetical protein Clacol_003267 [Clathrus columnatus]|uniref:Aldehyde dehydrogenase domain-containing protein n=1 Tax=Clathrus columnatus TaxID=1419009 RepID=A0AAV5A451_9AGAM|nr:hypothetical protein Clacol_003267 [Clathrus columnatus]
MDIGVLIGDALYAYKNIDKWVKPETASFDSTYSVFNPVVHHEPKGVVLIIGPYNYPLYCIGAMAGAIASGCAMVIKPSELSPATAKLLADLFPKYLDAIVATAAAKHLTPVTLELGGKSPALIHSSADFEVAARRLLWAKMVNAGQTCLAPDYFVILDKDKDRFVEILLRTCKEFYGDDPQKSNSFGRLRAGRHFDRVSALLRGTRGKIIYGGQTDPDDKYIAPTIVIDVGWDDVLMEEWFRDWVRENTLSGVFMENDAIIACASLVTPLGGVEVKFRSELTGLIRLSDRQFEKAKALFVTTIPYARPGEPSYWTPKQIPFVATFARIWASYWK